MPLRSKPTRNRPRRLLPTPDAVGVLDDGGEVMAWDLRATHALQRELGRPNGCDEACRARCCIEPIQAGNVFRHAVAPTVSRCATDDEVIARWLELHPNPVVNVPGKGGYEPRDGCSVADVVRAAVREGIWTV